MNDFIEVRRIRETDVDQVYEMIQKTFDTPVLRKVYEDDIYHIWKELYSKAYIRGCIKQKHFYIAVENGKVLGTAAVSLDGTKGYVSAVYIDPDSQGKGVGRKLLQAIEQDDISQSTGVLYLHALLSANKFYQKMGYHYQDDDPVIIEDSGVDVVAMEKKIL